MIFFCADSPTLGGLSFDRTSAHLSFRRALYLSRMRFSGFCEAGVVGIYGRFGIYEET